jgi:hypothetical protein
MPDAGYRTIATVFNRRHTVSRKVTVSKPFVGIQFKPGTFNYFYNYDKPINESVLA